MNEADQELELIWRGRHKEYSGGMIDVEEIAGLFHPPVAAEVTAARACPDRDCRRARTCGRPTTCREPAMVDRRELLAISAEMAAAEGVPDPLAAPKT